MVANYQTLRDRGVAAVDRVHGETVRIEPQTGGSQYAHGGGDPNRQAFEIVAVLRVDEGVAKALAGEGRRGWNSEVSSEPLALHVDRRKMPDGASIKVGDLVIAVDRDNAKFSVVRPDTKGHTRLVYPLAAL